MGAGLREQRPCHMPTTRGPPKDIQAPGVWHCRGRARPSTPDLPRAPEGLCYPLDHVPVESCGWCWLEGAAGRGEQAGPGSGGFCPGRESDSS